LRLPLPFAIASQGLGATAGRRPQSSLMFEYMVLL